MSLWKMMNYSHFFGCTNRSDCENHVELYILPKVITKGKKCG